MNRRLILLALCFGAAISVDKGDYVKPVTRRPRDVAATTVKQHAEAIVRRTHVPIFPKDEATTARVPKLVGGANLPIKHELPKLHTLIPPRLPVDNEKPPGTARPKRFVFHRRTHGTRKPVDATVVPKNATGVEATTQGPKEIKGSGLRPGFGVPRPTLKPLPKSVIGALPTEPVVPRKIEATTVRIVKDASQTLGPIVIRPGTERPKVNESVHVTPKYVVGTGAVPLADILKSATTARVGDPSRTIGPIATARLKRQVGGFFSATKNSGPTNYSGGVQGSRTIGDTTWTGGVKHSTDLHNGNTQVQGGFQRPFGSGTINGGGHVNVDNHGRTNHGVHVGVTIPF